MEQGDYYATLHADAGGPPAQNIDNAQCAFFGIDEVKESL